MKYVLYKTINDLKMIYKWLENGEISDSLAKDKLEIIRTHYTLHANKYEKIVIYMSFPDNERVKETYDGRFYIPSEYSDSGDDEFVEIINEDKEIEQTINNISASLKKLTIEFK